MMDYSKLVDIALKGERAATRTLWDIGGELKRLIPADTPPGGVTKLLTGAAAALAAAGLDYKASSLKQIRTTALNFPSNARHADLSFTLHRLARQPSTLEAIRRVHPVPTKTDVTRYMRVRRVAEERALAKERAARAERKEEARRRKEAAERSLRGASTPAVRRDAEKRIAAAHKEMKENAVPPKLDDVYVPEPGPEEHPALLARVRFLADVMGAKVAVVSLRDTYADHLSTFSVEEIERAIGDLAEITEAARAFAEELKRYLGKARLTVVA